MFHARVLAASLLALFLLTLAPGVTAEEPAGPDQTVERLHGVLIRVMREAETLGYPGREALLEPVVEDAYDLGFMARKSVGRHWKVLSEAERQRFTDIFGRLTVANYAGRFTGYDGERFETEGEETSIRETVLVKTVLVRPDDDSVRLNYRLHETSQGWRIIDVYMNGTVSELALRRSEYSALLKREGFPSLMEALDEKISDLEKS